MKRKLILSRHAQDQMKERGVIVPEEIDVAFMKKVKTDSSGATTYQTKYNNSYDVNYVVIPKGSFLFLKTVYLRSRNLLFVYDRLLNKE